MVVLASGVLVVFLVLYVFVSRGRYAGAEEFPDSVEHAHLRRVAEGRISALAPGAIRLSESERTAGATAGKEPVREFWRRFARASGLVEGNPAAALRELRDLPGLLEEALSVVEREEGASEIGKER